MSDSKSRSRLHVMNPPISEAEEIPFDPAKKGHGVFGYQIEFSAEEMRRIGARSSRGKEPFGRWIKRTLLEAADREAVAKTGDSHAAD